MKARVWVAIGILLLLPWLAAGALADEATDVTASFRGTSPGVDSVKTLYDFSLTRPWNSQRRNRPTLTFIAKEDAKAYGAYICFAQLPEKILLEVQKGEEWQPVFEGPPPFLHFYVPLEGVSGVRLQGSKEGDSSTLSLMAFHLLSQGEAPAWVQRWEKKEDPCDLMLIVSRPGEELSAFGDVLATYVPGQAEKIQIVVMADGEGPRQSGCLNALWAMGLRRYPELGGFGSSRDTVEETIRAWKPAALYGYLTEMVRRHRPQVVITHGTREEDPGNVATARATEYCAGNAWRADMDPGSFAAYGGWQVNKLYLWSPEAGGLALPSQGEQLQEAWAQYGSLSSEEVKQRSGTFLLVQTQVGPDQRANDVFENIPGLGESTYVKKEEPLEKIADSPAWKAEWMEQAGARNGKGFLQQGEFIYESVEEGLWFYASPEEIIRVDRRQDPEARRTWYEAHLFVDLTSDARVYTVLFSPDRPGKEQASAMQIARENKVVFGMSGDYYSHRFAMEGYLGVIVRGGKLLYNDVGKVRPEAFPNLDTLALYPDGAWKTYGVNELTAQEYMDKGALEVFSFGPILVRDGQVNPLIVRSNNTTSAQPRAGLGMIEPGHYFAMLEEGRMGREASGTSVPALAQAMKDAGCVEALNMDGGRTAVFVFMGKQITRITQKPGAGNLARQQSELISCGVSTQVDPFGD